MTWRNRAACHTPEVDPGWFDVDGQGALPVLAMRVCGGCPVRTDCLFEALDTPTSDDYGVWGGTSPRSRNEIRQRRMSPARAMSLGDRVAGLRTEPERLAEDEPWLLEEVAS